MSIKEEEKRKLKNNETKKYTTKDKTLINLRNKSKILINEFTELLYHHCIQQH